MAAVLALDGRAVETRERLAGFVDVVSRLGHVRQRENARLYVRGLIEQGGRKSLQATLFWLEETPARYESLQQFLADSPWDPGLVVRRCAERVCPELGVEAWVFDDTGFPKDGKRSPGVKRQYSGTLGKIGNWGWGRPGFVDAWGLAPGRSGGAEHETAVSAGVPSGGGAACGVEREAAGADCA
jgi:DDE superfamily endonuclease